MPESNESRIPEEPFASWEALDLRETSQRDRLDEIIKPDIPANKVAETILSTLINERKDQPDECKGVVIEHDYIDRDFIRAYSSFYSRAFRNIPRFSKRLHFFRCPMRDADLYEIENYSDDYLGYVVVRPLRLRNIGRSVLKPSINEDGEEYYSTAGEFMVHIAGHEFKISGAAFMEQDGRVAACASVAIWMSVANMARNFGLEESTTVEITEAANEYVAVGRPLPSEGLVDYQITEAIRSMGYEPIQYRPETWEQAKDTIYAYVESQIPPILYLDIAASDEMGPSEHAITVVGHGYKSNSQVDTTNSVKWPGGTQYHFYRSSRWVPYFISNDDQQGPYMKIVHASETELWAKVKKSGKPDVDEEILSQPIIAVGETLARITGIMVPMPPRVSLSAFEAERKAIFVLGRFAEAAGMSSLPSDLVLRTYLLPSNLYKSNLIERSDRIEYIVNLYRAKPMPRWIWVTEVSTKEYMSNPDPQSRKLLAEVLIDSTSNPLTDDFIGVHFVPEDGSVGYAATFLAEDKGAEEALAAFHSFEPDYHFTCLVRH